MARRRSRNFPPFAPILAWSALALRSAQMLAASAQVIGHRTNRVNSPAQLFEMGSEKAQAAMESSHAMARRFVAMQSRAQLGSWNQWAALLASGLTPFHARALKNARRARRR